jgi:DNA-binding transcriptional LysR family regulator
VDQDPWFGVELRHLAALSAVARERSFRGAADRLGYVQSAVSQQVANLERLVGVRLVDRFRGAKEVHLTEAGELLRGHADEILARLQAARADLNCCSEGAGGGALKVGVSQSVATGLLPDILRRLAVAAPDLHVIPVEVNGDGPLFELLERGAVDVAFRDMPLESGSFRSCTIITDPCALLVARESEWARRKRAPTAEELARLPLIALGGWHFQTSLEAWFAAHGLNPSFPLRAENEATVRAFVAAGLGAAIVPALGVTDADARVAVLDLGAVVPTRRVVLYWHGARRMWPALEAFRQMAQAVARDLSDRRRALAKEGGGAPSLAAA